MSWRKRPTAGAGAAVADEENAIRKPQQPAHRAKGRASLATLAVVALVGCSLLAARSLLPRSMGNFGRPSPIAPLAAPGRGAGRHSFRAYSSLREAVDDAGAGPRSAFGAVQLCSTASTTRGSFETYTVIPRHDIYYADGDVRRWEPEDAAAFSRESGGANGTGGPVGFSLSKVGKSNFARYGSLGAYLRLTVFEAELCGAGRCPPGWTHGISILSILESHATQEQGKVDQQWTAFNSEIAERLDGGGVECLLHDAASGEVVHRTAARVESGAYGGLLLRIFCQVDAGAAAGALGASDRFGVSFASPAGSTAFAIHGDSFDVCRMEGRRHRRQLARGGAPPGAAICLRPLSLHRLFDSEYTVELEHLVAWTAWHVYLAGAQHVYVQDRWGEIGRQIESEPSSWAAGVYRRLVDDAKITLISFPYFSPMQTDKHASNMRYLSTYDQVLAYEVCLAHARQMGDAWLVPLDSDEWFRIAGGGTGGRPAELGRAIDSLLESRGLAAADVAEIKFLRFDMHSHASAGEGDEARFVGNASQWPVEAYGYRAREFHPKPRSTLSPWNAGVMNIHEDVPIYATGLLPEPPRGEIVTMWDEPLEHAAIAHFTCSQVTRWPLSQWCPCPPGAECVRDAYFSGARAQLMERLAL